MQIVIDIPNSHFFKEDAELAYELIKDRDDIPFGTIGFLHFMKDISKNVTVLPEYEKHIDHTDCIYYPEHTKVATCSQYRDGWNDAMDYVFKNGKGYQPYRS